MTVSIRPIAPDDYVAVESIENAADQLLIDRLSPESWEPAPSGLSRASKPGFVLVAEEPEAGTIVGFVHVLEVDGIAHLEQISVLPQDGRRGYGRRLVEAAMDEARRRGYEQLTLRTYADVPWNAPFYARAGFVETAPTTDFHKYLVEVEERLGLARYGRRVQMTAALR
ncbi:GNAT family N-acetyltransferase [Agromyces sp. ISL-38]|uniref:GNAT family N-acetyltransferase n=1 Tax=Agromyces sp. ISL-38 TaxID=2819107 RepID=UPI001BE5E264|nr:GNAT family N-acetyltransferase [Agromyces sp. ISL-38]MBT2500206.1 GNAT family N-acetyltransferase [Agromyces sp. ISL-38]